LVYHARALGGDVRLLEKHVLLDGRPFLVLFVLASLKRYVSERKWGNVTDEDGGVAVAMVMVVNGVHGMKGITYRDG
jgi:hypothetical protein